MEEEDRERSKEEREEESKEEGGETQRRTWQLTDLRVLSSNTPICFQMGFGGNNFGSPLSQVPQPLLLVVGGPRLNILHYISILAHCWSSFDDLS